MPSRKEDGISFLRIFLSFSLLLNAHRASQLVSVVPSHCPKVLVNSPKDTLEETTNFEHFMVRLLDWCHFHFTDQQQFAAPLRQQKISGFLSGTRLCYCFLTVESKLTILKTKRKERERKKFQNSALSSLAKAERFRQSKFYFRSCARLVLKQRKYEKVLMFILLLQSKNKSNFH